MINPICYTALNWIALACLLILFLLYPWLNPLEAASDLGLNERNQYATEFAVLRRTLDELIENNAAESLTQPVAVRQSRSRSVSSDTTLQQNEADMTANTVTDTLVRRRQSLFNRIFRPSDDTVIVSNERVKQLDAERLEITRENSLQETSFAGTGQSGNSLALQTTFRRMQEKEKQLILTNFELLDHLKEAIDNLRVLELNRLREAEFADFTVYRSNFQLMRSQLIFAIAFLLILIFLLIYFQRRADKWEKELINEVTYSNRLALEKSNLLANISHEIRTPLNALLNIAGILKDQDQLSTVSEKQKLTEAAYYNISAINNTITDILHTSKLESSQETTKLFPIEFFSPTEIISQVVSLHKSQASLSNIELVINNGVDPRLKIRSNPFIVRQVFSNLLGNAIKYMDQAGQVVINLSLLKEKKQELLQIEVIDQGIGIDPDDVQQIFRKYFTAHPHKGFGLGLYLSKAMLSEIDGEIGVHSKKGVGSTFYFSVPFMESALYSEEEYDQNIPGGLSVLVVEDNPINLLYVKQLLLKRALIVHEASSVRTALDVLGQEEIDLVITDIHLPDQSGWDLLKQIRASTDHRHLGVFSTTAGLDAEIIDENVNFDGRLGKPFIEQELNQMIAQFLASKSP